MDRYAEDIYTKAPDVDVDTLKNLGPLRGMAGIWQGTRGLDVKPGASDRKEEAYIEHIELQPIDPQVNGPQLYYGLRYHTHVVKPNQTTFHDQVGYWLWEPATQTVIQTFTIPQAEVVMASGKTQADAEEFELIATHDDESFGIRSTPFLEYAFKTLEYRIKVALPTNGTWSYEQDTVLKIHGKPDPFHHTDRNTLNRIAEPTPNPLARR